MRRHFDWYDIISTRVYLSNQKSQSGNLFPPEKSIRESFPPGKVIQIHIPYLRGLFYFTEQLLYWLASRPLSSLRFPGDLQKTRDIAALPEQYSCNQQNTMGCTTSTPVDQKATKADMGSRRGVGHTERMGSRKKERIGIGHTERMGRAHKAPKPNAAPQAVEDGEDRVPELDDEGIMTEREVARRTSASAASRAAVLSAGGKGSNDKIKVKYAFCSQRGYYPDDPNKANQDSFSITHSFAGIEGDSLFAVYDGHGRFGHDCANFAKKQLPKIQAKAVRAERIKAHKSNMKAEAKNNPNGSKPKGAFNPKLWPMLDKSQYEDSCRTAALECNKAMHKDINVDDTLSGTTVISASFHCGMVTICNIGDSRAVLGSKFEKETVLATASGEEEKEEISEEQAKAEREKSDFISTIKSVDVEDGKLLALPLSQDQTPYRPDERERVKLCGARVMTVDQIEGLEPIHEDWGKTSGEDIDEIGDPPRIWRADEDFPGTAFTRSLGDTVAEDLGVTAEPEMVSFEVSKHDKILVLASDGVFEFLTNQQVIDMCSECSDPLDACKKVVDEAYKQWLHYEIRTDDITIIVMFLDCDKDRSADGYKSVVDMLSLATKQGQKPMVNKSLSSDKATGERSNSMYGGMDTEAIAEALKDE